MASAHSVAASIPLFVPVEMIEGLISTFRMRTSIAVMRVEAIINVAVEVMPTMEPGAGSDEHAAVEPLGPVVTVRSAVVWREVVVAIRARRCWSDIDRDLRGCRARNAQHSGNQDGKNKKLPIAHVFLLVAEKSNPDAKVVRTQNDSYRM
jgi:hypothetical protein